MHCLQIDFVWSAWRELMEAEAEPKNVRRVLAQRPQLHISEREAFPPTCLALSAGQESVHVLGSLFTFFRPAAARPPIHNNEEWGGLYQSVQRRRRLLLLKTLILPEGTKLA